jgi:hypothetical protein
MSSIASAVQRRRTHGQSPYVLKAAPRAAPPAIEEMTELKLLTFNSAPL